MNQLSNLVKSVEENHIYLLKQVIEEDKVSDFKIPPKFLAGALVIAAENRSIECINLILEYNETINAPIPLQYINAAFDILAQNNYGVYSNSIN